MAFTSGLSEGIAQAQLKLALTVFKRDLAEVGISRVHVKATAGRTTPIGMIQPIENLKTESDVLAFSRVEVLKQPDIPVLEAGLIKDISAPLVGEGSLRWLQNVDVGLKCIPRIVCAEACRLRDLSIHDPTRSESVVGVSRITAPGPNAGEIVIGLN